MAEGIVGGIVVAVVVAAVVIGHVLQRLDRTTSLEKIEPVESGDGGSEVGDGGYTVEVVLL